MRMKIIKVLATSLTFAAMFNGCSSDEKVGQNKGDNLRATSYGVLPGSPSKPLAIVFTTDISSSLNGTFTSITKTLHAAGYTIAAVDVICHGQDVQAGETPGLGCWAARIQRHNSDIFTPMISQASDAISDLVSKGVASGDNVVAIGVSRGGYAAVRLAAVDYRVKTLVLMAPVTELVKLAEFKNIPVPPSTF